jgi:hypothetical protein
VRARSFRFVKGAHFVKMYYVNKSSTKAPGSSKQKEEVGAHSFCSRCGVHVLHAPNSHSTSLDVNVDCLNQGSVKLKPIKGKDVKLSVGVPIAEQWDQDNQDSRFPTSIVDPSSPMIMFPPVDGKRSKFSGYQHHPLLRNHRQDLDILDDDEDDAYNIDLMVRKEPPATPSTVYSSQTESFLGSSVGGVPPTLTLDTRDCSNDTESVVSLSSNRSAFRINDSVAETLGESTPSLTGTTTPMMRHQMNYYMRKHMSSSSSVSSSSLITPKNSKVELKKSVSEQHQIKR